MRPRHIDDLRATNPVARSGSGFDLSSRAASRPGPGARRPSVRAASGPQVVTGVARFRGHDASKMVETSPVTVALAITVVLIWALVIYKLFLD